MFVIHVLNNLIITAIGLTIVLGKIIGVDIFYFLFYFLLDV